MKVGEIVQCCGRLVKVHWNQCTQSEKTITENSQEKFLGMSVSFKWNDFSNFPKIDAASIFSTGGTQN